jgi:CheY-like chemotaxis protein
MATVLLVDDNPVNLSVLRALLGREGFDLINADSGEAALDLVRANPTFDLVLLDVSMPGIDGIEVCRMLKEDPATDRIPIVLVSGVQTGDASIQAGLCAGACGYLTKPIDNAALLAWVHAILWASKYELQVASPTEAGRGRKGADQSINELGKALRKPLVAIYAAAEALTEHLPDDSPGLDQVAQIASCAESIAELLVAAKAVKE